MDVKCSKLGMRAPAIVFFGAPVRDLGLLAHQGLQ